MVAYSNLLCISRQMFRKGPFMRICQARLELVSQLYIPPAYRLPPKSCLKIFTHVVYMFVRQALYMSLLRFDVPCVELQLQSCANLDLWGLHLIQTRWILEAAELVCVNNGAASMGTS